MEYSSFSALFFGVLNDGSPSGAAYIAAGTVILLLLHSGIKFLGVFLRQLSVKWREAPLPPGPWGLPVVGHLLFLETKLHKYLAGLSGSYGPIFRLRLGSRVAVVISSPELAREALHDNDVPFANHSVPSSARAITYGGVDIVWSPHGSTWRMLRRVCVRELLSPSSLASVANLRRAQLRLAVRQFHTCAVASLPVDFGDQMFATVLNVVTSMMWGGTVAEGRGGVGREFREMIGEVTRLLGTPNISDYFSFLETFDPQGICAKMASLRHRFDRVYDSIIERKRSGRVQGNNCKTDFVDYMLQLEEAGHETKTPFTRTHLKAIIMDIIVGGTDTTSNTLEFAMAEMLNKPETIQKAQFEIDRIVGRHCIVEECHISKLPYLSAVIRETLRLHPAVPLLVPRRPSCSCTVGGYTVPKDSQVFINVWAIHRSPAVWDHPNDFRPERFMDPSFLDRKWDGNSNNFIFFPFGSGRRICAGIAMAEKMLLYSLASLLHSFDWKLHQPGTTVDLSEKHGIVLKKAHPLIVVPVARLSDPKLYSSP